MKSLSINKSSVYAIKMLAVLLLWAGFFANPLHAASCYNHSTTYYSTNHKAQTACNADEESTWCSQFSGCGWGSGPLGAYFYFRVHNGLNYYWHYYVAKYCAEGQIIDIETGECLTPPQPNADDNKKLGCNENPCGLGISPAVGQ